MTTLKLDKAKQREEKESWVKVQELETHSFRHLGVQWKY